MAAPLKPVKLAFDDVGKSAGKAAKTIKDEVNPVIQELSQVAGQLGGALVTAFLNGDSAAKALNSTLKSVAASATDAAIKNLIQGKPTEAAISGGIALAATVPSRMFGSDDDAVAKPEPVPAKSANENRKTNDVCDQPRKAA